MQINAYIREHRYTVSAHDIPEGCAGIDERGQIWVAIGKCGGYGKEEILCFDPYGNEISVMSRHNVRKVKVRSLDGDNITLRFDPWPEPSAAPFYPPNPRTD